jgi:hypothetical protein
VSAFGIAIVGTGGERNVAAAGPRAASVNPAAVLRGE